MDIFSYNNTVMHNTYPLAHLLLAEMVGQKTKLSRYYLEFKIDEIYEIIQ